MNESLWKLAAMTKRISFTARLKGMPEVISRPPRRISSVGTFIGDDGPVTSVLLEVADTEERRRIGMMGRKDLPWICGMLFTGLGGGGHFWMKDCLIPLDVAFVSKGGHVVKTYSMKVDREGKEKYLYGPEAASAVELHAGFLKRFGIGEGFRFETRGLGQKGESNG